MRRSFWVVLAVLLAGGVCPVRADVATEQVMIEPKIAEVSEEASKKLGVEYTIFQPIDGRDAKAEYAFVVTPTPDNKYKIEVTGIVFGRGAEFRRWVPQNPQIVFEPQDYGQKYADVYYDEEGPPPLQLKITPQVADDGSVGMNVDPQLAQIKLVARPIETSKVYIDKQSIGAPIAPFLFAAIGSQYEASGAQAASSPGTACSSSGSHSSGSRGDTAGAIDRVGMAAGMGLLASQAKGQIEGQKAVFLSDVPFTRFLFKTEAYNKDKKQLITLITPVIIQGTENTE